MEVPWTLTVRTWLGVAWSVHFLFSSLATGLDEAYNNKSSKTTAIPDNSSYSTDIANRTTHGNSESGSENIFTSQGFINGVLGAVCAVLGVAGWCFKSHSRRRRAGQQPPAGAESSVPPPVNAGVQPAPQTWSLTSATSSSLPSGVTTSTAQPSALFSTTSVSGIDYSNNNFLSNYSTASNYSNVGRL